MRWMSWPPACISMVSGSTTVLSAVRVGKEISFPLENLWLTFCRVVRCHDCIMYIVSALLFGISFLAPFFCLSFPSLMFLTRWSIFPSFTNLSISWRNWTHSLVVWPFCSWYSQYHLLCVSLLECALVGVLGSLLPLPRISPWGYSWVGYTCRYPVHCSGCGSSCYGCHFSHWIVS